MSERRLVSIRRRVPVAGTAGYDDRWARVRECVEAEGGRAWRFRSLTTPDLHLEFVEYRGSADPRAEPAVAGAFAELDALAPPLATEEWIGG